MHSPEPRGRTDPRSGGEGELEAAARAIGGGRVGGTGGIVAALVVAVLVAVLIMRRRSGTE